MTAILEAPSAPKTQKVAKNSHQSQRDPRFYPNGSLRRGMTKVSAKLFFEQGDKGLIAFFSDESNMRGTRGKNKGWPVFVDREYADKIGVGLQHVEFIVHHTFNFLFARPTGCFDR